MNADLETNVEANSREFSRGVEAGLNSEDTEYWRAGYELGQEIGGRQSPELGQEIITPESDSPLFLGDTLDGQKSDQDEKDKSAE